MEVRKLPIEVQCLLSASAKINNYRRVVEELVYNSLDAGSTCIAIRIHIQNNWIQVVDNGIGIKKADYKLLGDRYATSKLSDINTLKAVPSKYGYKGQALANIIEVSKLVKVTSRYGDSDETWVKIFVEGKIKRECIESPARPSKGTTVEISDFLYNLDIQKKYVNAFNELQDIKTFLEQLLLVFNNVSISLRDDSENEIIFKMHKNRDIYQTFKSLFDIDTKDFQELQVEKNEYKVKAFIGVDKKGVKNYHWIYLNNKLVNTSNLHKIINNKFAKQYKMKLKKIKTTVYQGNEENSIVCDVIPFYFIFLTCPYYEYDIVNSGKQTTVEFKDWFQVNSVIEKLVNFFNGELHLINKNKTEEVSTNVKNTKDEIKNIMEKFLGRTNKLARVSQMRNGVKGKQIRRKKKKQKITTSVTKIMPPKVNSPCKNEENLHNVNLHKEKKNIITNSHKSLRVESTHKMCASNKQQTLRKKGITKPKIKKRKLKMPKSHLKCKCYKPCINIKELFRDDWPINKKIRSKVLCDLKDNFNNKGYEKFKGKSIIKEKYENSYMNTKRPDVLKSKQFGTNKKIDTEHIRTYDLLQTLISSQQGLHNQDTKRQDTFEFITKSNVQRQTYVKNKSYAPTLTFESHNYNIDNTLIQKKHPKVQFISKQSRDNFDIGIDKRKKTILTKHKNTKTHDLFHVHNEKNRDLCNFRKLLNKYNCYGIETPFSIDISSTDVVEVSKMIRNQIMDDMKSLIGNEDCDEIYSPKSQLKFGFNFNIERTYTILVDSFNNNNSSQAVNLPKNHQTFINETITYTNLRDHGKPHSDHVHKTSSDIFRSDSSHTSKLNVVEPLDVCEIILHSSKDADYDQNNSFDLITRQDSIVNLKESRNISKTLKNNEINQLVINDSENKTSLQENIVIVETMEEDNETNGTLKAIDKLPDHPSNEKEKFGPNKTNMVLDSSLNKFNLNARHRFVPKGMSQIFKNCNSKNICSYNLDTEYYENMIYDNFAEDIAVNSEIYEPRVQNLKDYATEHIQKATEKLKKHNADLIFGADSLRNAKVLGQVDCKFIAAIIQGESQTHKSQDFLVCFDQHAVHERIGLEMNLSEYVNDNNWKKVSIDAFSLKSSKDEILYLHNHKDKFTRFGLDWTILNNSEILVNAIPEAIRGKNPRPREIILKSVQDLILEQIHAIKYQKGNVSLYPQSIMDLVFSEACRYAIKFGDHLSKKDCIKLISELADCKTPFQCAHGRPVIAVLLELKNEKFEYKANTDTIMQFTKRFKK